MKNQSIAQFVKLWSKEYDLTIKMNQLYEKRDHFDCMNRSTRGISTQLVKLDDRRNKILDKIEDGVKSGKFTKNAVKICKNELGFLEGYVSDCYYDLCSDY